MRTLKKSFFIISLLLLIIPFYSVKAAETLPRESFLIKSKDSASTETALKSAGISSFKKINGLNYYEVNATQNDISSLTASGIIESAEKNSKVALSGLPNDPSFQLQTYLTDSDIVNAWNINSGSPAITVAVIDTGVDYNQEDLKNKMWKDASGYYGYDFVNSDNDPMDDNGHGTEVSGIIAAQTNNGIGIAGIANVKIMAVKAVPASGEGDVADLARGIIYAADNGARVANVSLGLAEDSSVLDDAITYARNKNCLVVAASGNLYRPFIDNPARNPDAVGVGAIDVNDEKTSYSNYGEGLSIVAPGNNIYSTSWESTNSINHYNTGSGTSFATPQVTGVAALIISQDPSLTSDQVKKRLISSAKKISSMDGLDYSLLVGYGKLDAYNALTFDKFPPTSDLSLSKNSNGSYTITGTIEDDVKSTDEYADTPDSNIGLVRYQLDSNGLWTNLNQNPIQILNVNATTLVLSSGDHDILVETSDTAGNKATFDLKTKDASVNTTAPAIQSQTSSTSFSHNLSDYRATIVSQSPYPTQFSSDGTADMSISFKNTGKATWYQNTVRLGTSHPNDRTSAFADSSWASPNRVLMQQDSVAPGEEADFTFTITLPPNATGNYKEYFNLVVDGVGWFPDQGIYWNISLNSANPGSNYSAQFMNQSPYATMSPGEEGQFWADFKNIGGATWNYMIVNLGTSHPLDRTSAFYDDATGSGWESPNRVVMSENNVASGDTARFSFTAKAPQTSGTYYEYFQPVADGIGWMQDAGLFWKITVQ